MPEISFVILTFNSKKFIKSCLDSVFSQGYRDFEVILVDNGSGDNTLSLITENYPAVRLIKNKQNLGVCRARNQGIELARGKWILTLDCDVTLKRDFLFEVLRVVEGLAPETGIIQPKILKADIKTIYSCGIYLSWLRRFFDIGKGKPDNGQFNSSRSIFGACSAAALYKREMLEDIKQDTGYFDERFFFLVEDVDLSWRARTRGWRALYCPEAVCYHSGNSSGYSKKFRQYLCFRNRYYSIIKNDSFKEIFANIFLLLGYNSLRFFYLLVNNSYTLKAVKEIYRFIKNQSKYSNSCN